MAHIPVLGKTVKRPFTLIKFIESANTEQIVEVLLEEFGHSIDYKINGNNDTYGDEGAIFSFVRKFLIFKGIKMITIL